MVELENRNSPINQIALTKMLIKLNRIKLKIADENPFQTIEHVEKTKITYSTQSKKLMDGVVDHIHHVCGLSWGDVLLGLCCKECQ